jgi:hypothetical protein
MNLIEKILKFLWILQEKENVDGKLGNGSSYVIRLNPYNPLSYIVLIIYGIGYLILIIILIIDEIVQNGIKKLFKWH